MLAQNNSANDLGQIATINNLKLLSSKRNSRKTLEIIQTCQKDTNDATTAHHKKTRTNHKLRPVEIRIQKESSELQHERKYINRISIALRRTTEPHNVTFIKRHACVNFGCFLAHQAVGICVVRGEKTVAHP